MRCSRPITAFVCLALLGSIAVAQTAESTSPELLKAVRKFVGKAGGDTSDTKYIAAYAHLSGNSGQQAIVYLIGSYWCGTGGCTAVVLQPKKNKFYVMSRFSVTQLPIRVLETASNGWQDIGVWVEGGGISPGYEARLQFNGSSYPRNPTGHQGNPEAAGAIVIPKDAQGVPLTSQ
jgi:hypothetical protein